MNYFYQFVNYHILLSSLAFASAVCWAVIKMSRSGKIHASRATTSATQIKTTRKNGKNSRATPQQTLQCTPSITPRVFGYLTLAHLRTNITAPLTPSKQHATGFKLCSIHCSHGWHFLYIRMYVHVMCGRFTCLSSSSSSSCFNPLNVNASHNGAHTKHTNQTMRKRKREKNTRCVGVG